MNVEERVREHVKDLQRHIKANIFEDAGGKVRHATSRWGSPVVTRCCSCPSLASLVPSGRCSSQSRGNINPSLRRAFLQMVVRRIESRTTSYLFWSAHPSNFRSVSVSVSVAHGAYRTFLFFLAIINIVNFYLDKPNVVSQLGASASGPTSPAVESYIYEALRKHHHPHHVIDADISPNVT